MPRPYYTLLSTTSRGPAKPWAVEFGDFARVVVVDEMRDMQQSNKLTRKYEQLKFRIIGHLDNNQQQVVATLNKVEGRSNV